MFHTVLKHTVAPLVAGSGAALCITLLASLGTGGDMALWLMAPFGATMVLLFALPASPLAQPRNIVCGHLLTALVGLALLHGVGVTPWSLGFGVGLAVALMMVTGTVHPPAGANPLLVMLTGQAWSFALFPVLVGSLLIVGFGLLYHRLAGERSYPVRWW